VFRIHRVQKRRALLLWDQLSPPWQACVDEAWEAYKAGSIPIGAAIVDAGGCVLARGRNCRWDATDAYPLSATRIAHAEMNAILALDGHDVAPSTCTLYTTMEPCPMCMGAIRMVHLRKVCYAARDALAGSTSLVDVPPYTSLGRVVHRIEVADPPRADLESALLALQAERLLRVPASRWASLVRKADLACVPGIELGERLSASGDLLRLREGGASAREAVEMLVQMLDEGQD
jgi:tRNA(adenine34) deaminase